MWPKFFDFTTTFRGITRPNVTSETQVNAFGAGGGGGKTTLYFFKLFFNHKYVHSGSLVFFIFLFFKFFASFTPFFFMEDVPPASCCYLADGHSRLPCFGLTVWKPLLQKACTITGSTRLYSLNQRDPQFNYLCRGSYVGQSAGDLKSISTDSPVQLSSWQHLLYFMLISRTITS